MSVAAKSAITFLSGHGRIRSVVVGNAQTFSGFASGEAHISKGTKHSGSGERNPQKRGKKMVYQRGKQKMWWYRFRFGGRIIHESSRSQSRTIAREAERERRRELEESWNRITKRVLPPTFERAASEWLNGREGRVAASTLTIGRVSIMHLTPAFGAKLLCDIAPKDVEAYQQTRLREGVQGRTVNIEIQVLRQILKAFKCWQHLEGEIHSLRERRDVGRALTPDEENRLLAECAKADSACYTAVVLALNTAMRKDEIRRLQWKQIDLFQGVLIVGKSKTDAGTGRVLPLNPSAVKALADWRSRFSNPQPGDCVFPSGWRKAWRNALKRAGLKARFHDLRHTAITKLAEGLASEQTIMSIAGHVSRQMLEHYSHIRLAAKRTVLDSIATPLSESTNGKMPIFKGDVHQIDNQIGIPENGTTSNLLN
jgi:integrase